MLALLHKMLLLLWDFWGFACRPPSPGELPRPPVESAAMGLMDI